MNKVVQKLVVTREMAAAGVDYRSRGGAGCPWCGERARIYCTLPWDENTRIRYHRCENDRCPIATMGITIKSIEVDK